MVVLADEFSGISFLPKSDYGYVQAPYEPITKEKYHELISKIKLVDFSKGVVEATPTKFCDNSTCTLAE